MSSKLVQEVKNPRYVAVTFGETIDPYTLVKWSSTVEGTVVKCTAATDHPCGITTENGGTSGKVGDIVVAADAYPLNAGGTWAPGDYIAADANGKGVVTTTAGNGVIGMARTVSVDAQRGSVEILKGLV